MAWWDDQDVPASCDVRVKVRCGLWAVDLGEILNMDMDESECASLRIVSQVEGQ